MQEEISKEEMSKEETTIKETPKKKSLLSKIIGITFAGSIVCGLLYVLINLFFTGMYLISAFKESETENLFDSEDKYTVIQEEWIPLAERTSHPQIREVVNKLFTWERGTYDINLLYINEAGEVDSNITLYNSFMQGTMTKFLDKLSIGGIGTGKLKIAESGQVVYIEKLLQAIEASYIDVNTSPQISSVTGNTFISAEVLRVMVNAYFGIFDDTEGCYDGDRPLTRAEFLAGLYKTRFPVQELTINEELAWYYEQRFCSCSNDPNVFLFCSGKTGNYMVSTGNITEYKYNTKRI